MCRILSKNYNMLNIVDLGVSVWQKWVNSTSYSPSCFTSLKLCQNLYNSFFFPVVSYYLPKIHHVRGELNFFFFFFWVINCANTTSCWVSCGWWVKDSKEGNPCAGCSFPLKVPGRGHTAPQKQQGPSPISALHWVPGSLEGQTHSYQAMPTLLKKDDGFINQTLSIISSILIFTPDFSNSGIFSNKSSADL